MKPKTIKKVKAWVVVDDVYPMSAWGTMVEDPTGKQNVWQYPTFTSLKEARSWKKQKGVIAEEYKIVPCTITYSIPKKTK